MMLMRQHLKQLRKITATDKKKLQTLVVLLKLPSVQQRQHGLTSKKGAEEAALAPNAALSLSK